MKLQDLPSGFHEVDVPTQETDAPVIKPSANYIRIKNRLTDKVLRECNLSLRDLKRDYGTSWKTVLRYYIKARRYTSRMRSVSV